MNTPRLWMGTVLRRSVYIEGGLENENFRAYAPEDKEDTFDSPHLDIKLVE